MAAIDERTQEEIFEKLDNPPIPLLLLVNREGDILLTHSGNLRDPDDFFGKMKQMKFVKSALKLYDEVLAYLLF